MYCRDSTTSDVVEGSIPIPVVPLARALVRRDRLVKFSIVKSHGLVGIEIWYTDWRLIVGCRGCLHSLAILKNQGYCLLHMVDWVGVTDLSLTFCRIQCLKVDHCNVLYVNLFLFLRFFC